MPKNVKITTIPGPLDLLAPHSCRGCGKLGNIFCDCCKNNITKAYLNICPSCKSNNPTGDCPNCNDLPPTYVIGERTEPLSTLIQDFKYHSVRAAKKPLAELLNSILPNYQNKVIIVPLPTTSKHIRSRGLDHTLLVAKQLSKYRGNSYSVQRILLRHKDTVQVGTDKKTRLSQAEDAYIINPRINLDPKATYLLLDDIWTTGATMHAAIKKLREFGANKINLALLAFSNID